jgi:hypothetical protein
MHFFNRFERNFLFGLTRVFAMLIILSILIMTGIAGVLFSNNHIEINTKVSTSDVIEAIKPPPVESQTETVSSETNGLNEQSVKNVNILPSIKMPFILQKHFNTPDNLRTLKGWLDSLSENNRQEFIDEMALAVTEAESLHLPPYDAINKYRQLKNEKLEKASLVKAEQRTQQLYFAGAIILGVSLIALFSLILVLLAIERNTRPRGTEV